MAAESPSNKSGISLYLWLVPSLILHIALGYYVYNQPDTPVEVPERREQVIGTEQAKEINELIKDLKVEDFRKKVGQLQNIKTKMVSKRDEKWTAYLKFEKSHSKNLKPMLTKRLKQINESLQKIDIRLKDAEKSAKKMHALEAQLRTVVKNKDYIKLKVLTKDYFKTWFETQAFLDRSEHANLSQRLATAKNSLGWVGTDIDWDGFQDKQLLAKKEIEKGYQVLDYGPAVRIKKASAHIEKDASTWKQFLGAIKGKKKLSSKEGLNRQKINFTLGVIVEPRKILAQVLKARKAHTAFMALFAKHSKSIESTIATGKFKSGAHTMIPAKENRVLDTLGMKELYDEAVALEFHMTKIFKEARAAMISVIQRQIIERSLKDTIVPYSLRPKISADELSAAAVNADDIKRLKKAVKKAGIEMDGMIAITLAMLDALDPHIDLALPSDEYEDFEEDRPMTDEDVANMLEDAEEAIAIALQAMTEARAIQDLVKKKRLVEIEATEATEFAIKIIRVAAKELKEKDAKILDTLDEAIARTKKSRKAMKKADQKKEQPLAKKAEEALMKSLEKAVALDEAGVLEDKEPFEHEGEEHEGEEHGEGEGPMSEEQELEMMSKADYGLMVDVSRYMVKKKKGKGHGMPGWRKASRRNVKGRRGKGGQNYKGPPEVSLTYKGFGAQKIMTVGKGATWFHLNNWYIIGPFPNKGRKNLTAVFPPQSIIDLNAVYKGKDGKSVKWQYVSSPSVIDRKYARNNQRRLENSQIHPPDAQMYVIYYGYTELWCEEAQDRWLAVGSDDRADIWINGYHVWQSSNRLKAWEIGEGLRRVHFKKGRNKILLRLENGWYATQFSVIINLNDKRVKQKKQKAEKK